MARKNYSKFSKKPENEEIVENNDTHVVSPELEEAVINAGGEVMRVEPAEENNEAATNLVLGVISGCARLHVRQEPSKESESLCVLNRNTEVTIDDTESTEDFYKVCTAAGIEGYCMKKFIVVK